MHDAQFADGFDGPETVAFGLAPAQLLTVVSGLLVAYMALQAPLPPYLSAAASLVVLTGSAALGWLRLAGRPLTDWLVHGGHYLLRRRSGPEMFAGGPPPDARLIPAARNVSVRVAARTAHPGRMITFFSLKGGSGRTTLATELSCLLADRFRSESAASGGHERLDVVMLDLDAIAASVATRLGLPQPTPWEYATGGHGETDPSAARLVHHKSGIRVLLGPPKPLHPRAQELELGRIDQVAESLRGGPQRVVVVDIGTDLGAMARWGLEHSDQIYVVLTPTPGGILDAYRSTEVLRRLGHRDKLAYVVNRCSGAAPLDEVMADLGGDVVAVIPPEPGFRIAEARNEALTATGGGAAAPALAILATHVCAGLRTAR